MLKNRTFKVAFVLAFIYVSIGSLELFTDVNIAKRMNSLVDGLDLFTIFPAHILGSMVWLTLGNASKDYIIYAWIGQGGSLVVFTAIFYILMLTTNSLRKFL